jgi:S1-C subfamily serine protease
MPILRLMPPLYLLAVAVLWVAFAEAQSEPRSGNDIADPVQSGLWPRLTAMIQPPPGAHSLVTGAAFFIPSPDAQSRLMTVGHAVDGCLRIDLLSDGLQTTRAELMSLATAPDVAMLRVPEMPPGHASPVTLTFRPLGDPPTPPGATLKVLGYPAGDDLLKSTMIEMVDITDTVPKPPKARGYVLVQGQGARGYSGAPILNSRALVVGIFQGNIIDPEKATNLMGAPIEHVSEGPSPLAINEGLFLKHPVGPMPVSSGTDNAAIENVRSAVARVVCWRESLAH